MTGLNVSAYDKNGITCRSLTTTCNISNSVVTGSGAGVDNAQNGIELYGIAAATVNKDTTVSHNTYSNPEGNGITNASGILVINVGKLTLNGNMLDDNDVNIDAIEDSGYAAGPTQGAWAITSNKVSDATNAQMATVGDEVGDGIDLSGAKGVTVYSNTVTSNAEWGIALFGETNSKVGADGKANTVTGNTDDGIYVGEYAENDPSTGNSIAYNKSNSNVGDGILAAGPDGAGYQQAMNNTFAHNTLQNNDGYDAEDLSIGMKTAGTANTWTGDKCLPAHDADPGAICG